MNINRLPTNWVAKIHVSEDDYYSLDGEPCWFWTGARNKRYGKVKVGSCTMQAHRAVYEHLNGSIPDGLEIDHLCLEELCVNPSHLEPVTRLENMRRSHWHRAQLLEWELDDEDDSGLDLLFAAVAATGITHDPNLAIAEYRAMQESAA